MRPVIYCQVNNKNLQTSIKEESRSIGFWEIKFDEKVNHDIALIYHEKIIEVKGTEIAIPISNDISSILDKISPLDLSYVEQLFDSPKEQIEMIHLVRNELTQNLNDLIKSMEEVNGEQIKQQAHKLHSKLLVLSIPAIDSCRFIEEHAQESRSNSVQNEYRKLKMFCLIRLWQIDNK